MGSETEPAKLLLPYLQRADELQKHEPLVAYYCRLYAMEKGLKIPTKDRTKTTNALLISLINQLEKDKKSVKLGAEDHLYVEGFASNVFAKADKQDRAGRADLSTAKTFYAASIFFEILNQFGELQPDIEQRQKYAIWKAAEIRKALKEGRRPEPGPPGGDKDLSVPLSSPSGTTDLGPSQSLPSNYPHGDPSYQPITKLPGRSGSFSDTNTGTNLSSRHEDLVNPHTSMQVPGRSESFQASSSGANLSPQHGDDINPFSSTQGHMSPSSYSSVDYTPSNLSQHPPPARLEISAYPQPHQHQPYSTEPHPISQNYQFPENQSPAYSYPNFQTYPSFHDTTFPSAPTHQPSPHQSPDVAYSHSSAPTSNHPPPAQYDLKGIHSGPPIPSAASYNYDINYQPPAEKIAEAHKAARFAVGALAFDDVTVAVDFLRRSLELLTNPSAESH